MSDRLMQFSDDRLAAALVDVGGRLAFPVVDVAAAVGEQVGATAARGRVMALPRTRTVRRAVVAAVAAVLLLGAAAAAGRLGVPGLRIVFGSNPAPTNVPVGRNLFLGTATTLEDARDRLPFAVYTPRGQRLGPASVYVRREPPGGRVSLVYPPGPGLPRSKFIRAGLLITEFDASLDTDALKKLQLEGTRIESVTVNGYPGLWFSGKPHELQYLDRDGIPFQESSRLAGNTLVWSEGTVTLRLECDCSRDTAVRIADSIR